MVRECILKTSEASGLAPEDLTTLGDLYGLDMFPYNESVTIAPHVSRDSETYSRWDIYLWREYMKSKDFPR